MTTQPAFSLSPAPHTDEVRQAKEDLAHVETLLIEAELKLATLQQQLAAFEEQYRLKAERLCEVLERLTTQLAALVAKQLRDQVCDPAAFAWDYDMPDEPGTARLGDFTPSVSLKQLYREAAKRFHPDLAQNEEDRIWRTQIMRQVNAAFAAGDTHALRNMLAQHKPSEIHATTVDDTLAGTRDAIRRTMSRLAEIQQQQRDLEHTDMGLLFMQAERSGMSRQEFLRDLVISLKDQIAKKQEEISTLLRKESRCG
jgi:hypothetical protein